MMPFSVGITMEDRVSAFDALTDSGQLHVRSLNVMDATEA